MIKNVTSLVFQWSESLTTNREVPGSIPGSTMGIFEGEDSRGDHGLGRLVEFRFKAPPGTTTPSITTHTPSGQRNCGSWASHPQKSVTLLPCPGGRTTKSTKGHVVAGGDLYVPQHLSYSGVTKLFIHISLSPVLPLEILSWIVCPQFYLIFIWVRKLDSNSLTKTKN